MHKRIQINLCIQTYSHTNNILTHKQTYTRVQYKTPTLIGQDVSTELLSLVDVQYSSRTKQALLSLNLHSDLRLDWGEFLFLTMKERVLLIHFVVFHSVPPFLPHLHSKLSEMLGCKCALLQPKSIEHNAKSRPSALPLS